MGGCSRPVELYWIGMGAALERCSVDGGVTLYSSPSFGPSQRSGCGSAALKFTQLQTQPSTFGWGGYDWLSMRG